MEHILQALIKTGASPFFVGGCVRDNLLGQSSKDVDVEVFGLDADTLADTLARFGRVDRVGASFGVIKLTTPDGQDFDFSLPRRDNKTGTGHKGFMVEPDPTMTPQEAASRRDFTFNSLAQDPATGKVLDFFGGVTDLEARVLRHTSPAFAEDPLRVLRGFQFAGRFGMVMAPETVALCRSLAPAFVELPLERVWGEWFKWATKSIQPSAGLRILAETGWLAHFPELAALQGCPQDPEWHPEGDVWAHTLHVTDAAATLARRDGLDTEDTLALVLAALCHDLGKPATTEFVDGHWRAHGHDKAGEQPTCDFLARLGAPHKLVERVVEMVMEHMIHVNGPLSDRSLRRFLARLKHATVADVVRVIEADHSGRPPLPQGLPVAAADLAERAAQLGGKVEPVLLGRHLLAVGVKPGPAMGNLLRQAFEAQLDGAFANVPGGLAWLGFD